MEHDEVRGARGIGGALRVAQSMLSRNPPPKIVRVQENSALPSNAQAELLRAGQLHVYPSIVASRFLSLSLKNGSPTLRTTNYVGVLPVNANLTLEIQPKVPVGSIAAMLARSNQDIVLIEEQVLHEYATSKIMVHQLLELLALQLLRSIERLFSTGLHKEYRSVERVSQSFRGALVFRSTLRERSRNHTETVGTRRFQRTSLTAANLVLRHALTLLAGALRVSPGTARTRRLISECNRMALRLFDVAGVPNDAVLRSTIHQALNETERSDYRVALRLAQIVTESAGLEVAGATNGVPSQCFLLNLDLVFEDYVRSVLLQQVRIAAVKDAKHFPPHGERRLLLTGGTARMEAEPDVVLLDSRRMPVLVIDVKYKTPEKSLSRSDVNQILGYGVAYGVKCVALVVPSVTGVPSIEFLGSADNISAYRVGCDIASTERSEAERQLATDVEGLL